MESFSEVWTLISESLKSKMTDVAYKTWIVRIEPLDLDFDKGIASLIVPNDFHKQTLLKSYIHHINDSFTDIFGTSFQIEFFIKKDIAEKEEQKSSEPVYSSSMSNKDPKLEFTFESFIVGPSNKLAHAAAEAVAKNPSMASNPFFLYGNSGLGKTHLIYAIGNYIKEHNKDAKICYVMGDDFTNELIQAIRKSKTSEFHDKYRNCDILLVDDVQFIGGKEQTQEEFFHTFNKLYDDGKQIVLTSDRPPKEIKTLEDRLRSRFETGLMADITPPDLETRIAILKRKAEKLNFELPDDVCNYIAERLKSNIRQLEGVVKKLSAKYMLNHEKPSIKAAMETISDVLNNDTPPELTIEKIIDEVARTYDVSSEEIRSSKGRTSNISNARQIAIYISHELTGFSLVKIGEEFGNRHYTTIVYALQKTGELIKKNSSVRETVEDIIKNIRDR